jgi:hypothetical protein
MTSALFTSGGGSTRASPVLAFLRGGGLEEEFQIIWKIKPDFGDLEKSTMPFLFRHDDKKQPDAFVDND